MRKAIIFTGGGAPASLNKSILSDAAFVVAADSGYDTARMLGCKVDLCVGDFDSTRFSSEIEKLEHVRSLRDKDESDTLLAMRSVFDRGIDEYVLVGGGGYRMDHLFTTFALFDSCLPPTHWFTAYETLVLVKGYHRFENLSTRDTISFLPAGFSSPVVVTAKQLQWPLENHLLSMQTLSLSNRPTNSFLDVFVQGGKSLFACFPVADKQV
ncbi:MAG: thiamine diphosphokinase [Sphaerochaeta sp.]|uniref:thiamine diphosphokinase n=1 Tax=Sphaerochaeta sp. TaxID=1972642 RepID=UPI0029756831|nr:thiamine diphosphokinase [Sphaerochaeta sp.]MDD3928664.1 thiamine diphosphokinase [Sphaerochaeta sp.]